ncbi:MAG TPA: cob(I)yrinic acid a,c-diamide adenosyltransferase [Acidimicrobiales bacterium]|nr:cob(I)yrinic acid a,c-diamide adenosyltransferase [Acidimicrobiales bacterium]
MGGHELTKRDEWAIQCMERQLVVMDDLAARAGDTRAWLALERQANSYLRHLGTWLAKDKIFPGARSEMADHLGIEWHTLGDGFTWESTDLDETAAKGRHAWDVAAAKLASGDFDLLILDELTYAVKYGWVDVADVVAGVRGRAPHTNVVITGRDAPDELVELADTVTEMRKVKHAYDQGIKAKKGIEY